MKTRKPTLVQILHFILDALQKNILPKDKDALNFLTLIKQWEEEPAMSPERRRIFKTISETYKRRCNSKDPIKRKNEMWSVINTILPILLEKKEIVFANQMIGIKKSKKKSFFSSLTFNSPLKNSHEEHLTWINH